MAPDITCFDLETSSLKFEKLLYQDKEDGTLCMLPTGKYNSLFEANAVKQFFSLFSKMRESRTHMHLIKIKQIEENHGNKDEYILRNY